MLPMVVLALASAPALAFQMVGHTHVDGPSVPGNLWSSPSSCQSCLDLFAVNLVEIGQNDGVDLRFFLLRLLVKWCPLVASRVSVAG